MDLCVFGAPAEIEQQQRWLPCAVCRPRLCDKSLDFGVAGTVHHIDIE